MEQDVAAVREETAAGRQVTVWFTADAVGVPVGGSAKVLAVGDVEEGDFIQVRPVGSKDTMYCSPGELTRSRPPRRRSARATEPATDHTPAPVSSAAPARRPPTARAAERPDRPAAAKPVPDAAAKPGPKTAPDTATKAVPDTATKAAPSEPKSGPRRGERPGEIAVTLAATPDGEWSVEVLVGRKRVVTRTPVPAADVATAARSLPAPVVEVIESSLESARRRQRERVEQLRAELDAAQRMLDQLV